MARALRKHRILVVNPIVSGKFNEFDRAFFNRNASSLFQIDVKSLKYGPASIESSYDETLASPFVVQEVVQAEKNDFEAVIINCFMDPGIEASKEISRIHVVGAGESSINLALLAGDKFSIIDVGPSRYVSYSPTRLVVKHGVQSRFVSVRGVGIRVLDLDKDLERTFKAACREGEKAVREDGADVIVLGCTGLAGLAHRIQDELKLPVIDPAIAALRAVETLILARLIPNKVAYPRPPRKSLKLPF